MKTLLWLDDLRNPFKDNWVRDFSPIGIECEIIWIKKYYDFCYYIEESGIPDAICFDHALSDIHCNKSTYKEKTGYDCAKFLVEYCLDNKLQLPLWSIQSSNPAGKTNIQALLENYTKFINK